MNYDYQQTEFSKSLMAGLFAGLIATLVNLAYDFFYRDVTGFALSEIINVPTIIMASTLLLMIAGLIFYLFHHYMKNGSIVYRIIFLLLTVLCIYLAMHVQRSADPILSNEFQWLLSGVVLILGGTATFYLPYLFDHDKIFN